MTKYDYATSSFCVNRIRNIILTIDFYKNDATEIHIK